MPIFPGSRYEGLPYVGLKTKKNKPAKWLEMRARVTAEEIGDDSTVYTVQEGDVPDLICYIFGVPTRLWWLIADVNDLADPFDLTTGQRLIIPGPSDFASR